MEKNEFNKSVKTIAYELFVLRDCMQTVVLAVKNLLIALSHTTVTQASRDANFKRFPLVQPQPKILIKL